MRYTLSHRLTARQRRWLVLEILDACQDHDHQPDQEGLEHLPDQALLDEAIATVPSLAERLEVVE